MKLSQLFRCTNAHGRAEKIEGSTADVDVHHYLTRQGRDAAAEQHKRLLSAVYGQSDLHIDRFMPGFAPDYRGQDQLVADLVAPIVNVTKASDKFVVWDKANAYKSVDAKVSPRGLPTEVFQAFSSQPYLVEPYALRSSVANDLLNNADQPLDLLTQASADVRDALARSREIRVSQMVMDSANYAQTSALTGGARWDVPSTSDPISDIMTLLVNVNLGVQMNAMVLSLPVWQYFRRHPKVVAAMGSNIAAASGGALGGLATEAGVKAFFGLEHLIIANAKVNTTQNTSTPTYAYAWGKGVSFMKLDPSANMNKLCFMKTFRHEQLGFITLQDQMPGMTGITTVKGFHSDAEKVVAADAGYLLDTVIS